jgi:hypothetical protein
VKKEKYLTDRELGKLVRLMVENSRKVQKEGTNKKVVVVPKSGSEAWIPKSRGRIPAWVKKATGLTQHKSIVITYGPKAEFIEGQPIPNKL